jgi:hypothetical protein
MDLLATILTCSLYASDDAVVRAIAEGPSGSNPYLIVNTADGAPLDPPPLPEGEREATARAAELRSEGARLLLGLLQIPPSWLDAFGRPLASAFDPCVNIAIGTAMLSEFDAQCASKVPARDERSRRLERTNRRACVLHRYEAAIGSVDFADAIGLELSVQRPRAAALEDAPIFAPPRVRDWGPDQLLVPLRVETAPRAAAPARLP